MVKISPIDRFLLSRGGQATTVATIFLLLWGGASLGTYSFMAHDDHRAQGIWLSTALLIAASVGFWISYIIEWAGGKRGWRRQRRPAFLKRFIVAAVAFIFLASVTFLIGSTGVPATQISHTNPTGGEANSPATNK